MAENENTPETNEATHDVKTVEHTAEEHAKPDTQADDTKARISNLEQTVNGLIEQVASLAPNPQDKSPHDVPWTHKGPRS